MRELKQIGMASGMGKNNFTVLLVNAIDEKPIRFNMTFPFPPMISMQRMIFVFWQQRLFVDDHVGDFTEFINVQTAFSHQLELFFESLCKGVFQHRLVVWIVPHKVFPHFIRGIVPLCRYFSTEHGVPFRKSGFSLGVEPQFSGFRVAVLGADGALVPGFNFPDGYFNVTVEVCTLNGSYKTGGKVPRVQFIRCFHENSIPQKNT